MRLSDVRLIGCQFILFARNCGKQQQQQKAKQASNKTKTRQHVALPHAVPIAVAVAVDVAVAIAIATAVSVTVKVALAAHRLPAATALQQSACQLIRRSNFYDIIKQHLMAASHDTCSLAHSLALFLAWRHLLLPFMCSLQT